MNYHPLIAASWLALLLVGCDKPASLPAPLVSTNLSERVFETRGVVRSWPENRKTLVVRHEEIPGYMPKMTMELNVRDPNELRGLERDDEVTFRLVATADTHWIKNIQRVGKVAAEKPVVVETNLPPVKELSPGELLPDYELLAEDGRTVRFSDFRGRAVAFTFIFTRCPLPDFCPRVGNNLGRARELILAQPNAPTNWQFLSISFDPQNDTPEVLRRYADFYRHNNSDRWLFAAAPSNVLATLAPEVDLMFARDAGGSISHNLRTVVLNPQGRIHHQFDGNKWSPEMLAEALLEAAKKEPAQPTQNAQGSAGVLN